MAGKGRFIIVNEAGERVARVAGKVPEARGPVVVSRFVFSESEFAEIAAAVRYLLDCPTAKSVGISGGRSVRPAETF